MISRIRSTLVYSTDSHLVRRASLAIGGAAARKPNIWLIAATAAISILAGTAARGQSTSVAQPTGTAAPTYTAVIRDANSCEWQATNFDYDVNGQWAPHVHSYTELASGLNHLIDGQWVPSVEAIDLLPDGSVAATNGQHQVFFPVDISQGVITVITPDGQSIESRPSLLCYVDGTNSATLAVLKSSVGALVASNQVLYADAFDGIQGDLLFTYTKAGLEQDVVLHQQPVPPESVNFSPNSTRLEMFTEMAGDREPQLIPGIVDPENNLQDTVLKFGTMSMIMGRAFSTEAGQKDAEGAGVFKSWLEFQGHSYLVEKVPYNKVLPTLQSLPVQTGSVQPITSVERKLAVTASLSPRPPIYRKNQNPHSILFTKAENRLKPGLVLDYVWLSGVSNSFTFQANRTYFMSSSYVEVDDAVTFEGGTVIKFAPTTAAIRLVYPNVTLQSGPYRPIIMTAQDDNSVGEIISGSTGVPSGYYGDGILLYSTTNMTLHDIKMSYLNVGIEMGANYAEFDNIQAVNCYIPLIHFFCGATVNNGLFYNIGGIAVESSGSSNSLAGTQLTIDNCNTFADSTTTPLSLVNCLVTATTNLLAGPGTLSTNHVAILPGNAGIYQTVGAGSHYLANGSLYRGSGTNSLTPAVLAALAAKTTYPPLIYSNLIFSVSTNLLKQAVRDTNSAPDLGFHYDPIDFITDNLAITNSTLSFSNGVAIASYNEAGIVLRDGSALNSIGTPNHPNWLVRYQMVQDKSVFLGGTNTYAGQNVSPSPIGSSLPNATYQFTHFATPAYGGFVFNQNGNTTYGNLTVQHCEIWGGTNNLGNSTVPSTMSFMNNLFFRSDTVISNASTTCGISITNNLFYNSYLSVVKPAGGAFYNNDLDGCTITTNSIITNGFNAFINSTFTLTGTSNIVSTNAIGYQPGPLGTFYQPTNSPLIKMGNVPANQLCLTHFTVFTNQTVESNSIVTIGYHYVAVGTNGNPLADTNGIPFYIEDAGSTNQGPIIVTQPQSQTNTWGSNVAFSVTATGMAPLYYQWYYNGASALVGATSATLTLNNAQYSQGGLYSVIVTNFYGTATSANASLTIPAVSFIYSNFCDVSAIQINGLSTATNTADGCVLELVKSASQQYGSAFLKSPQTLTSNSSFSTFFSFRFSNAGGAPPDVDVLGADGCVFVVQSRSNNCVALAGGDMGYGSSPYPQDSVFTNCSVGVEFDTYGNSNAFGEGFYDPINPATGGIDGNHIGVDTNGWMESIAWQHINDPMNNSNIWYAWIDYNGVSSNLQVRVSETNSRPVSPTLTNVISISSYMGRTNVYFGFTGGNGGSYNQEDILSWQLYMQPVGSTNGITNILSVAIVSPTNQTFFAGSAITVSVTATNSNPGVSITQVQFFYGTNGPGTNLIGTATTPTNGLFQTIWTPPIRGAYVLTALAFNSLGSNILSAPVTNTIHSLPVISITSPTNGAVYSGSPTNLVVQANAITDPSTTITNVTFYRGTNVIGIATVGAANVFTITNSFSAGTNILSAKAFDGNGGVSVSTNIIIVVLTNQANLSVTITSPINQTFPAWSNIVITATATNSQPAFPVNWVQFFAGTNSLGYARSTNGIYTLPWLPYIGGSYVLTALAVNTNQTPVVSNPVTNTIVFIPTAQLLSPTNNQILSFSPTNVPFTASATAYGAATITNILFYQGTNIIGHTNAGSPYGFTWNNVSNGTYIVHVQAVDSLGNIGISSNISFSIYPTNRPPSVNPGTNQTIHLPQVANLSGAVFDDGLPLNSTLSITWTNIGHPAGGIVTFANPNQAATTATFNLVGTYTNQLQASDGQYFVASNMVVTVLITNNVLTVNAGTNQTLTWSTVQQNVFINITPFATNYPDIFAGFDYFAPSNGLVLYDINTDDDDSEFDFVSPSWPSITMLSQYGTTWVPSGAFYAFVTVKDTTGGFTPGDVFVNATNDTADGEIYRIRSDGTLIGTNGESGKAWVVLPGAILAMSMDVPSGAFGGDLLVLINGGGGLWKINSAGQATEISVLSGSGSPWIAAVPNNSQKYGPWAGRVLLIGSYNGVDNAIIAVDQYGFAAIYNFPTTFVGLQYIPANENMFGWCGDAGESDETSTFTLTPSSELQGNGGVFANVGGEICRLVWDGQAFQPILITGDDAVIPQLMASGPSTGPGVFGTNVDSVQLSGSVTDTGPLTNTISINWLAIGGPGPVLFDNPTNTSTVAHFTQVGTYLFQLTANDGEQSLSTNVTIQINASSNSVSFTGTPIPLSCGVSNSANLTTSDFMDPTVVPGQSLYANYYSFSGQYRQQISLQTTDPNGAGIIAVLRNSSNQVLSVTGVNPSDNSYAWLSYTLPYSGNYLVEVSTASTNGYGLLGSGGIPYSLTYSCGPISLLAGTDGLIGSPIAVLLNGTNLNNGGTLSFGSTITNVPVTLTLTVTNLGVTNVYFPSTLSQSSGATYPLVTGDFNTSWSPNTPINSNGYYLPAGGSTTLQITFNASSNEIVDSGFAFASDAQVEDTDPGSYGQSFVLNLTASAFPPGGAPGILLTAPVNNTTMIAPATFTVAATNNGSTNISYVTFSATSPAGTVQIGTVTNAPYNLTWSNVPINSYSITATAFDSLGRSTTSLPATINVISASADIPPLAVNDLFIVPMNSSNNVFYPLKNDIDNETNPLTIIAVTQPIGKNNQTPPQSSVATIINGGTAVSYTPPYFTKGSDQFNYEISDAKGGTSWATINVAIDGANSPQVVLNAQTNAVNAGVVDPLTATVSPSNNIAKVAFYQGLTLFGVVTNGVAGVFTTNWTATYGNTTASFTAIATDIFGQVNTSTPFLITVNQPSGTNPPVANIINLVAGTNTVNVTNQVVVREGLFNLYGQALPAVGYSTLQWTLDLDAADGTYIRTITNGTTSVGSLSSSNILASCDLSTLINGVYQFDLSVISGSMLAETNIQFYLESNLKIGEFSFSQQDLVIPVNGIPLTVTRTYNSLNPAMGDFGYGWTYSLENMDVSLDEVRQDAEDASGDVFSERTDSGLDVTLTLPNGQVTTFEYYLTGPDSLGTYYATWKPAPGITATLQPIGDNRLETLIASFENNPDLYYWDASPETPWASYDFPGFILTTVDGTKYTIARPDLGVHDLVINGVGAQVHAYGPPYLSGITEPNSDTISISQGGVTFTAPNGTTKQLTFQRNGAGLITSISDPMASNGFPAVVYQYDDYDNLVSAQRLVNRAMGTYTTNGFAYTNSTFPHYITGMFSGDGTQVAENFYDSSGKLTGVQDANGNVTRFIHNLNNSMDVVVDRLRRTNTMVYDLLGNVIIQTNALGQVTTMAYDVNNNKTNDVTYFNGVPYATNSYAYDATNQLLGSIDPLGHTNSYAYDGSGNLLKTTDARGNSTINTYDANNNLVSTVDSLGNTTSSSYGGGYMLGSRDAIGTINTNYYDGNENLIATKTLDASGTILSTNSFTYDANLNRLTSTVSRRFGSGWTNATTTYTYDAMNRVVQTVDPDGGTNTVVYDLNGRQQATIDALGRTTSYTYDGQGRLIQTTYPDQTTTTSAYDANGNRISSTDALNRTTTYVYDALNRLVQTIYPDNTTNATVYDPVGRVAQSIDARGAVTGYAYDVAGRRLAVTNAFGTTVAVTNTYVYDANGNQITFTDGANHSTTNVFDALNRQVQVLYPDGTKTITAYDGDGRQVATTNQDNFGTLFGYDGAGRLTSVINSLNQATRYQYDEAGNELAQIDALNRTNTFVYDGLGRRILHTMPGSQSEGFSYDVAGNLIYHTNFSGSVITNQYDLMNRLTNAASVNGYQVGYSYTPTGQRQQMVDGTGVTGYQYDQRDRLKYKLLNWSQGPAVALYYQYDANGAVTNLASSTVNGATNVYSYDILGRLTNVLGGGMLAASYGYDAVGNLQTMRYANGVTNLYQYDRLNRLTNEVWKVTSTSVASFAYALGATGNRTNLTDNFNGTTRSYAWTYDPLYRLTNENISVLGNVGYGYDIVGNRTNRSSTISGLTNQVYTFNTNDWLNIDSYDANGNTTGSGGKTYSYDAMNRLTNVNNTIFIAYDGNGNRVSKTVGSTTTFYLLDDRNPSGYVQVLEEWTVTSSATNLAKVYNYGSDLISQRVPNTSTNYFIYDGHGSTRALTDNAGNVANVFTYDGYGTLIASNTTAQTVYLYSGEQFDPDLGQYYLRARTYNPGTGRFWTMDTYRGANQDPLSLHKYVYNLDNPVNLIDPSGHDGEDLIGSFGPSGSFPISLRPQKVVLDAFFTHGPAGRKLVNHWLDGSGTKLELTVDDMVEIGAFSLPTGGPPSIENGDNFIQYLKHLSGGPVQISDMRLFLGATERATLGRFWGHVSGTLTGSIDNWTFTGAMQFSDREKFDQSESGTWYRNAVCWLVSKGFSGKDYEVTSATTSVKQSSSDGQIEWAGTGKGTQYPGRPENGNPTAD